MRRTLWLATPPRPTDPRRGDPGAGRAGATAHAGCFVRAVSRIRRAGLRRPRSRCSTPWGSTDRGRLAQWAAGRGAAAQTSLAPGKRYSASCRAHPGADHPRVHRQMLRARPTGGWLNGTYPYVAAEAWLLGGLGDLDRARGRGELADAGCALRSWHHRRPAVVDGLDGGENQGGAGRPGAVQVALDTGPGRVAADDDPLGGPRAWVAPLPGLDPTTMGWKERDWYLPVKAAEGFDRMATADRRSGWTAGLWGPGPKRGRRDPHPLLREGGTEKAPGDRRPGSARCRRRSARPGSRFGSLARSTPGCWDEQPSPGHPSLQPLTQARVAAPRRAWHQLAGRLAVGDPRRTGARLVDHC